MEPAIRQWALHDQLCIVYKTSGMGTMRAWYVGIRAALQCQQYKRMALVLIVVLASLDSAAILANERLANQGWQPAESAQGLSQRSSILEGKRLFFEHEEGQDATNDSETTTDSLPLKTLPESAAKDSGTAGVAVKSTARSKSGVREAGVHYQARIEGSEVITIILNGLPCNTVNRSDLTGEIPGVTLTCQQLSVKELELQLLADGESVQVVDGKRVKGVIGPGGSL